MFCRGSIYEPDIIVINNKLKVASERNMFSLTFNCIYLGYFFKANIL